MSDGSSHQLSLDAGWRLDHTYAALPDPFFAEIAPHPVRAPKLVVLNDGLVAELGLNTAALRNGAGVGIFSGNQLPHHAQPIAQAYAGHQFGHFTMLGDGRAHLIGEQLTPAGKRMDIQLKGSGRTPFSRGGDGRAVLGPMLREYIISEAMHELGIPTTRSLAVISTGEPVYRETALPGAILCRVASSHIRVGTFQYAAALRDPALIRRLIEYTIQRHDPDAAENPNPPLTLLERVAERQARLIAQWMSVGFIHGVMNTDNMAVSGETIDYGPCAFMDTYRLNTVFSSIDRHARYAYGQQPKIAQWNLARFAETLLTTLHQNEQEAITMAKAVIHHFAERYQTHWLDILRAKLGWSDPDPGDAALIADLLKRMEENALDFTNTFAALTRDDPSLQEGLGDWLHRWRVRCGPSPEAMAAAQRRMRAANPAIIPRNHVVETVLSTAESSGDTTPLQKLLDTLRDPYNHDRQREPAYLQPAPPEVARTYRTYCGT